MLPSLMNLDSCSLVALGPRPRFFFPRPFGPYFRIASSPPNAPVDIQRARIGNKGTLTRAPDSPKHPSNPTRLNATSTPPTHLRTLKLAFRSSVLPYSSGTFRGVDESSPESDNFISQMLSANTAGCR